MPRYVVGRSFPDGLRIAEAKALAHGRRVGKVVIVTGRGASVKLDSVQA